MSSRKKFFVEDGESVSDCLDRMKIAGYTPVRRMEEPILKEVKKNGTVEVEVAKQRIVFEGQRNDG
ncbi:NETI protein [Evansella caseinilytica]|uniref:NETI protein n=1 Tax=Evansella caseinilytica TaxID=1503961 RepID=A0A1H3TRR5_9BACI|nr:NETI motif-containing protein [Evansella caseinilytica]SDZ52029.1 NETI protein [Evansella caseinilytica]